MQHQQRHASAMSATVFRLVLGSSVVAVVVLLGAGAATPLAAQAPAEAPSTSREEKAPVAPQAGTASSAPRVHEGGPAGAEGLATTTAWAAAPGRPKLEAALADQNAQRRRRRRRRTVTPEPEEAAEGAEGDAEGGDEAAAGEDGDTEVRGRVDDTTPNLELAAAAAGEEADPDQEVQPGSGNLRRSNVMEFDARLVRGETAGSGAVVLFDRGQRPLPPLTRRRKRFLDPTLALVARPGPTDVAEDDEDDEDRAPASAEAAGADEGRSALRSNGAGDDRDRASRRDDDDDRRDRRRRRRRRRSRRNR